MALPATLEDAIAEMKRLAQLEGERTAAETEQLVRIVDAIRVAESCVKDLSEGSTLRAADVYERLASAACNCVDLYKVAQAIRRIEIVTWDLLAATEHTGYRPEVAPVIQEIVADHVRSRLLPLLLQAKDNEPIQGRLITDAEIVQGREFHSAGEQTVECDDLLGVQLEDGDILLILGFDEERVIVHFSSEPDAQFWMTREQVCAIAVQEEAGA